VIDHETRGARYALRRSVGVGDSTWPVYSVDERGVVQKIATLGSIHPSSYFATGELERIQGFFTGIPYYLQDARPAGFLGRAVPSMYPELKLPARVADWTDDHFLTYLVQRATDSVGSLMVGAAALDRHLAGTQAPPVVSTKDRKRAYPKFAADAMAGTPASVTMFAPLSAVIACAPYVARYIATGYRKIAPATPAAADAEETRCGYFMAHRFLRCLSKN
jgi:hypothetical protein